MQIEHITEILKVYPEYGKWWVRVKINSYGHESETTIMCNTKEETEKYEVGKMIVV